jgi:diguanylate cyclase
MIIDIDRFKSINDTYGHTVGDEVIGAVGAVIGANVRPQDSAGRYGGDEFAVVIGSAPEGSARMIAERIRQQIEQLHLPGAPDLRLSSSIGLAVAQLERTTLRSWIDAADGALYRAKELGRNRVVEAD